MAVLLGAISDKAYVEYQVKGKKKRVFFPSTPKALAFKTLMKKNIRDGVYRETITNIRVKSMI